MFVCLQGLLDRDPAKRLGGNGGAEVQSHPFFNGLDWDLLYRRRITPPYNPCKTEESVEESVNFEEEFTSMPLQSVDETSAAALELLNNRESSKFTGFTYDKDSVLDDMSSYFDANEMKQQEGVRRPHSNQHK